MKRFALLALAPLVWSGPALAQHEGHVMPTAPEAPAPAAPEHDHAAMLATPAPPPPPPGAPPVAEHETRPPPAPTDFAADSVYDPARMARARDGLRLEHGGAKVSKVMTNLFEYQDRSGQAGYRWDGEGWFGGDIHRLVIKSEGEGSRREGLEAAEVQALYSRAVTRYTDLQVGVRQDFMPVPARTYATVGFETLLPYWFSAEAAVFLSDKGDVLGRVEGTYDLRLTQRVVLQPRAELNLSAQDVAATRTGSGLSTAELGLRLRYEIHREFAPYVGVSYERRFGRTADYARAAGQDVSATSLVVGLRAWF